MRAFCLPAAMTAEDIAALEGIIECRRMVKANEYIYRAGQEFTAIFAIISGAVKSYRTFSDGRTCITGCHLPGELFGFSGIHQARYSIDARALKDTWVCVLPFEELEAICRVVPGLQSRILHLMSDRIVDYHEHQAQLMGTSPAQKRLTVFLLGLSARAARRGESATRIHLPMTGQDIGNYLGVSPEQVSREFTRLARCNTIIKDNRDITILDLERLRSSVCELTKAG